MRKIRLTISILLISQSFIFGQGVNFEPMTLEDAMLKAKTENKIIFLLNGEGCAWGEHSKKVMKASVSAGTFFNENFINIIPENKYEFDAIFCITDSPRYFFIKPDGNIVMMVGPYREPEKLIDLGQKVLEGKVLKPNMGIYTDGMYPKSKKTLKMLSYAMQAHMALNFPEEIFFNEINNEIYKNLGSLDIKEVELLLNKSLEYGKYYYNQFLMLVVHELKNEKQKSRELANKILKKYPLKEYQKDRILMQNYLLEIASTQ